MYSRIVSVGDSQVIAEVAYDLSERRLRVRFRTGSVWEYENVFPREFARLTGSSSMGKAFNQVIRNTHQQRRIYPEPQKQLFATE